MSRCYRGRSFITLAVLVASFGLSTLWLCRSNGHQHTFAVAPRSASGADSPAHQAALRRQALAGQDTHSIGPERKRRPWFMGGAGSVQKIVRGQQNFQGLLQQDLKLPHLEFRQVNETVLPDSLVMKRETVAARAFASVQSVLESGLGSVLLVSAAALSVAFANHPATASTWLALWSKGLGPPIGEHALSLRGWVNEGLMALFFFSVGLEIKKEVAEGSLASPKQAALPCIAALGGMVIPMLVYAAINHFFPGGSLAGTTVPMATDIAFAMGVFHVFRAHMPPSAASFLLTLATVDDLGAIVVIALCFTSGLAPGFLAVAAAALGAAALLGRQRQRSARNFIVPGLLLWYGLLRGGLNADIAGVLVAFCVPMKARGGEHVVERLIPRWSVLSSLFILPLFALANCALSLGGSGGSLMGGHWPVPLGVCLGLLIGKPLGIFGFSHLSVKAGIASMPPGMTNQHLLAVGQLGAIGFTMCLFLIENALVGPAAEVSKLAVFLASVLGAATGALAMHKLPRNQIAPHSEIITAPMPTVGA